MQPGKCLGGCRPGRRYPGAQRGGKRAVVGVLERVNQCSQRDRCGWESATPEREENAPVLKPS